ncbi:hypothetical protein FZC66_05075 [Priestia megaterium]|nr:hypothetical protein FZC66_05075 [Priestia megaterium]
MNLFKGLKLLKYMLLIGAVVYGIIAFKNSDSTSYIAYLPYIQLLLSLFLFIEAILTFKESKLHSAFFLIIAIFCFAIYFEV